jgi:dinuclear metal center YbgI/SA1388 family protein
MKIKDIAQAIEEFAPASLAEPYDNVGLLVGDPDAEATGVLVNLDVTGGLIDEAVAAGINLIVTHHPIWFTGLKRLNGGDHVSRIIIQAIQKGVALYACHTNLDNVRDGVNRMIGERLGMQGMQILSVKRGITHQAAETGAGMVGDLPTAYRKEEFMAMVKERFGCGGIRYADAPQAAIQRVAWCGGAGSFLISNAISAGADAFLTGDITYHKFFDNQGKILLLDIGHHESEQFTSNLLHSHLSKIFPSFAVRLSKIKTNPVKYW